MILDEELRGLDPNDRAEREIFTFRVATRLRAVKLSTIRALVSAIDGHPPGFERNRDAVIRQLVRVWLTSRKGWVRPKANLDGHFKAPIPRKSPRVLER